MNAPSLDTEKFFIAAARAFAARFAGMAMPESPSRVKKSKQRSRRLTAEQKKSNRKKREYNARRAARQNNGGK